MTAGTERLLEGRAALVTGSSRGIGRAVALGLAAAGARVVVNGRADPGAATSAAAEAVAAEIEAAGGTALARAGSVADFDHAGALVEACVEAFGRIDVLVNCAGVAEPEHSSILDIEPAAWRELLDVHLSGSFHTCRHAAPRMLAQGGGVILNTSSHSFLGVYGGTGYPAAKGGTNSLTFALASELREHGVRANAVCPGARTRLSSGPAYEARIRDLHARGVLDDALLGASLDPPDAACVAPLYVLLASDLARDVTGRVFSVAGGYVGVFERGREQLLAWRDADLGPWSVADLAERVLAGAKP